VAQGWNLALTALRKGATSEQVAAQLRAAKFNVIVMKQGLARFDIPGRSVTFLVLDRERGARQIYLERWTSISNKTTNMLLTGMGQKDVNRTAVPEKQIHLCAFELPKRGDYLEISTQSLSPLLKGIIVFVGATLLSGCTDGTSTSPPLPPTPPPIPTDPVGNPVLETRQSMTHLGCPSRGFHYQLAVRTAIRVWPRTRHRESRATLV
jgi:hypothetical protein